MIIICLFSQTFLNNRYSPFYFQLRKYEELIEARRVGENISSVTGFPTVIVGTTLIKGRSYERCNEDTVLS